MKLAWHVHHNAMKKMLLIVTCVFFVCGKAIAERLDGERQKLVRQKSNYHTANVLIATGSIVVDSIRTTSGTTDYSVRLFNYSTTYMGIAISTSILKLKNGKLFIQKIYD